MQAPTLQESIKAVGTRLYGLLFTYIKEDFPSLSEDSIKAHFIDTFENLSNWYLFVEQRLKPYEEEIKSKKPHILYTEPNGKQWATPYEIFPGINKKQIPLETYQEINQCLEFFLNVYNAYTK